MSFFNAYITVIPKDGKDVTQCDNYRPISLLNLDVKFFIKILAKRLAPHLEGLIGLDQVGFMADREARDGTTRAIDLMYRISKGLKNIAFLRQTQKRHLTT